MTEDRRGIAAQAADLLKRAEAGGEGASLAARRAAMIMERTDPAFAVRALATAARLDPQDPAPRLAAARLHAEAGNLEAARAEAALVLKDGIDDAARARAAFMLGELARAMSDDAAARAAFDTALKIENQLLKRDKSDPTAARWYARARGRLSELDAAQGDMARAATGAEGALSMLKAVAAQVGETPAIAADIADAEMRLAALELDGEKPASARRRLNEAIARYEALAMTETSEPHWRAVLSDAWALAAEADYVRGAPEAAREAMDKALQARLRLAADNPDEAWALAGTWRLRAALREALGDHDAAMESLKQARAMAEQLVSRAGDADAPSRFLVHTLLDQADIALRTGAVQTTGEAADAALRICERFIRLGGDATWCADAGAAWDRLGEVAGRSSGRDAMLDAFARAVEFRRMATRASADDERLKLGLSAALIKLGDAALDLKRNEAARDAFIEGATLRLRIAEERPGDAGAAHALAVALERLGLALMALGERDAASAAWEDELALAERIFPDHRSLEGVRFRALVEAHLADAGGTEAARYRAASLARFDILADAGVLTEQEAALRRRLWNS